MRTFLIMPKGIQECKLIWLAPYLYSEEGLNKGISLLQQSNYVINRLSEAKCG